MIKIEMVRGDYKKIKFQIKNNGNVIHDDFDDIYITFKKDYDTTEVLFQKLLSRGDIRKDSDSYYHFIITPQDTNKLKYGTYVFDIQVFKKAEQIKNTVLGEFTITKEVTFSYNEEGGGIEWMILR